jgi:hypothetical protein
MFCVHSATTVLIKKLPFWHCKLTLLFSLTFRFQDWHIGSILTRRGNVDLIGLVIIWSCNCLSESTFKALINYLREAFDLAMTALLVFPLIYKQTSPEVKFSWLFAFSVFSYFRLKMKFSQICLSLTFMSALTFVNWVSGEGIIFFSSVKSCKKFQKISFEGDNW